MGLQSLFHYANLSVIFESEEIFQRKIIHKAKIEINEEGSIAAASTMLYTYLSMPENFICDHPFMFVIHDRKFNEVLFAGIYRGPENVSSNSAFSSNPQKTLAFSCIISFVYIFIYYR